MSIDRLLAVAPIFALVMGATGGSTLAGIGLWAVMHLLPEMLR